MHALVIEDDAIIAMLIEDEIRDCGFSSVELEKPLSLAQLSAAVLQVRLHSRRVH